MLRIERGRRPTADTVFRIQTALDILPGTLVPDWKEWSPIDTFSAGARTRQRRRDLDISLSRVAHLAGVSAATLSRFEREERRTPSLMRVETTPLGSEFYTLMNERLALALGFRSLQEHERFCWGSGVG